MNETASIGELVFCQGIFTALTGVASALLLDMTRNAASMIQEIPRSQEYSADQGKTDILLVAARCGAGEILRNIHAAAGYKPRPVYSGRSIYQEPV
jgi:hypothetical protein